MKEHLFLRVAGQRYIHSALVSAGYEYGRRKQVGDLYYEAIKAASPASGVLWVAVKIHDATLTKSAVTVVVFKNRREALYEFAEGEYPTELVGHIPDVFYKLLSSPARFAAMGIELSPEALAYRVERWNAMPEKAVKRALRRTTFGNPITGLEGAENADFKPKNSARSLIEWA